MRFRRLVCRGKGYELTALVSPEDYEWAKRQGNWFVTHGAHPEGSRKSGYAVRSVGKRLIWLHKEVLRRAGKIPPTPEHTIGDHLNGVRLDCRRGNLRWATPEQNARNRFGLAHLQFSMDL